MRRQFFATSPGASPIDEAPVTETVDPDEAFAALADDTRIGILRELWIAEQHRMGFTELREAVGVRDSGQFNYHLDKLLDRFVTKRDRSYELTAAGIRVVGAILGGSFTMEGSSEPVEPGTACPACGGPWRFRYEAEFARFECDDCPLRLRYPVPPGTVAGDDAEEMPRLTERYLRTLLESLRNELCPYCESPTMPTVVYVEASEETARLTSVVLLEYDCTRCAGEVTTDLATPLLGHPAVVSFSYERGVAVREEPIWRFAAFDDERTERLSEDPLEASVTFEADGDTLTLTVDEDFDVIDIGR